MEANDPSKNPVCFNYDGRKVNCDKIATEITQSGEDVSFGEI